MVSAMPEYKIPYELYCFKCKKAFEWTGYNSGDYMLFQCPKCHYVIGVKELKRKKKVE